MAEESTLYAVFNQACGHVVGCVPSIDLARRTLTALFGKVRARQFGYKTATDDDLMAVLRGDRCSTCTMDGQVTA